MVGVRAEGIGVRAWGVVRSRNGFRGGECRACRGQGRGGRVRWGWTSGLGGVGGRGRARTERFRGLQILVLNPTKKKKKLILSFFWGREGGVPGRGRQRPGMDWPSGLGGVGGRGRASTHGVFSWLGGCKSSVLNPTKIIDFDFFWGREGGPWSGRQRRELGAG